MCVERKRGRERESDLRAYDLLVHSYEKRASILAELQRQM